MISQDEETASRARRHLVRSMPTDRRATMREFSTSGDASHRLQARGFSRVLLFPCCLFLSLGLCFILMVAGESGKADAQASFVDLGPNSPTMRSNGSNTSGVVGTITGYSGVTYAIPKTGGVWISVNTGQWVPLANAPPRAFSMAIDSNQLEHLVVGERADDVAGLQITGRAGVWESWDSGNNWSIIYDPASETDSQRVQALTISPATSTIFVATDIGVRRIERPGFGRPPVSSVLFGTRSTRCSTQGPLGSITAVVASDTKVWARSAGEVFQSVDDGVTWECLSLPTSVDLPKFQNTDMTGISASYSDWVNGGNDGTTFAATDQQAFVIFQPFVTPQDKRSKLSGDCNKKAGPPPGTTQCPISRAPLLIIDENFAAQSWIAQWTDDNDGRGLGGRRFVRVFEVAKSCPAFDDASIGQRFQLIYSASQGVQQARSVLSDGTIKFDSIVGGSEDGHNKKKIHSDFWDVLLPNDYCPTVASKAYIAGDGGVFEGSAKKDSHLVKMNWSPHNLGLHTHNSHDLIISVPPASAVASGTAVPSNLAPVDLGYPSQDNATWLRTFDGKWGGSDWLGDTNNGTGDVGSHFALIWRSPVGEDGQLFDFKKGSTKKITLNIQDYGWDGPTHFFAIEALSNESSPLDSLDMVMLVKLPLEDSHGNAVADPSGGVGTGPRTAIIRNNNFNANPNGPSSHWKGWSIVSDILPQGAERVFVGGGHGTVSGHATQFFLSVDGSNPTCPNGLWKLTSSTSTWSCLIQGLVSEGSATYGPAFVDPFDPNLIFVIESSPASPAKGIIKMSTDAGSSFCDLPVLTGLVSESGRYPLADANGNNAYDPSGVFSDVLNAYHGSSFSVPSAIGFSRDGTAAFLVASPFTSVYRGVPAGNFASGVSCLSREWREPVWQDLSNALPTARAYITSIRPVSDDAYVSSEGRGAYALSGVSSAPLASWFSHVASRTVSDPVATLQDGQSVPISAESVTLNVYRVFPSLISPSVAFIGSFTVLTDAQGDVHAPASVGTGNFLFDILYNGDASRAKSSAKFVQTVN
jgi:hypothetical protein